MSAAATRELRRDVLQVRERWAGHDDLSVGPDRGRVEEVQRRLQEISREQHESQQQCHQQGEVITLIN